MTETMALFPLPLVVFPGATHTLKIFEPRYLDMVSDCMRNDRGFGITLSFEEDDETVAFAEIGTVMKIVDWDQAADGILTIKVLGLKKFKIEDYIVGQNDLIMGELVFLDEEQTSSIPSSLNELIEMGMSLHERAVSPMVREDVDWRDALWVGNRLAELLPLNLEQQQAALALNDPMERLQMFSSLFSGEDVDIELVDREE
ncbi:MAG: peptidase S16 [Methylococcales bacterium]|nr:peptidase S16 [Methylococcales bacterium]MBT7445197.1 peptidase S16 [Methylococcales bacterium]